MQIQNYTPVGQEVWRGVITLKVAEWGDVVVENIRVFKKGDRRWLQMPSYLNNSGDKPEWRPCVYFESSEAQRKFCQRVLELLDRHLENCE